MPRIVSDKFFHDGQEFRLPLYSVHFVVWPRVVSCWFSCVKICDDIRIPNWRTLDFRAIDLLEFKGKFYLTTRAVNQDRTVHRSSDGKDWEIILSGFRFRLGEFDQHLYYKINDAIFISPDGDNWSRYKIDKEKYTPLLVEGNFFFYSTCHYLHKYNMLTQTSERISSIGDAVSILRYGSKLILHQRIRYTWTSDDGGQTWKSSRSSFTIYTSSRYVVMKTDKIVISRNLVMFSEVCCGQLYQVDDDGTLVTSNGIYGPIRQWQKYKTGWPEERRVFRALLLSCRRSGLSFVQFLGLIEIL
jgi:hypothetical protein